MKPPRFVAVVRGSVLCIGLLLRAPLAAAQQPSFPARSHLPDEVRSRLAAAAQDPTLAPWQREVMQEVARGRVGEPAVGPSPTAQFPALPSAGTAADEGAWIQLPPPSGAIRHTAIYDPVRDRMLVFGGHDGNTFPNDVWALSLGASPAWSALDPAGSPPPARTRHTAIYDPVRDRMVVFGGLGGNSRRNDVWALSLAGSPAWSEIIPAGSPPSAREGHTAIYDPVRDRMVVFGGFDDNTPPRPTDVRALSLAGSPAWSALAPFGAPPGRSGHTAIYDPVHDRMVVFGGGVNDVWGLYFAGSPAWFALFPSGSQPPGRSDHTAIYDPVRGRMLVFGGSDGLSTLDDVWALTFSLSGDLSWSALAPAGGPPPARDVHTAIYDPVRDRMVVFGGYTGSGLPPLGLLNDVWVLPLASSPNWSVLIPGESLPPARYLHTAIHDPVRDRVVVLWGVRASVLLDDVWARSLAGSPAWSALAPAGGPPFGRAGHTAIYDPVRDRMVVFAGEDGSFYTDVWVLSLAGSPAWSALAPAGSPPPARAYHTAIYDPVRDRMVVFGGWDGLSYLDDAWALSLGASPTWSALAPGGSPPPGRYLHTAIYDPHGDWMVVFGGWDGLSNLNDVWALSLAGSPAWSALAPAGGPPPGRIAHAAIHDPVRDRMVVFGGTVEPTHNGFNDVWALSLAGSPAWSALDPAGSPPPGRAGHTAIYDPLRDRMVVFGGYTLDVFGMNYNDVWTLAWPGPTATLLSRFAAEWVVEGIEVRWQFGAGSEVVSTTLGRGETSNGPWSDVGGEPRTEGDLVVLVDRDVVAGREYFYRLVARLAGGETMTFGPVSTTGQAADVRFALVTVAPSPTQGAARIAFVMAESAPVRITVLDVQGRRAATVVDETLSAGRHETAWEAASGRAPSPAGLYFVRFEWPGGSATRRLALTR